ncbi:MAG: hypothetical protein CO188_02535 [Zetaproteobacteria bacterium CG_4_9_14_3_um_filter_54_145]|nr:MAG: hypothetical protein COZ50_01645 [Zetaproteobacteria bacterium CG_4_10_14_3_um_filter_54_28]PJA30657.1 MAG: hypothetical protein CO188_02535 [Zetaproteobacteria bacterium CG_4_9_14_3_um_filter_54_145]
MHRYHYIRLVTAMICMLCSNACAVADEHVFNGTCDASAAVSVGNGYMLVAEDEHDLLLLYAINRPATDPVQRFDFSTQMRVEAGRESDIEGAARAGQRIYWITSHGRNAKGRLRANRYQLFATDVAGESTGEITLAWAGNYRSLIRDALDKASWESPEARETGRAIKLLRAATRLDEQVNKQLAPKADGLNIEALAAMPGGKGLLIGLRNPLDHGMALLLHLKNADDLLAGKAKRALFGGARFVELGGLGLRSMAYSAVSGRFLIIAGPAASGGPFRLYAWDSDAQGPPLRIRALDFSQGSHPEAVVLSGSRIHILHDDGSRILAGRVCKQGADKHFSVDSFDAVK